MHIKSSSAVERPSTTRSGVVAVSTIVRVAIYVLLFTGMTWIAQLGLRRIFPDLPHWIYMAWQSVVGVLGIFAVTWLMRVKLESRPWSGMALPAFDPAKLLLGCAAGVGCMFLLAAIEWAPAWLRLDGPHWAQSPLFVALLPSLAVGFTEELAYRGYVFQTLGETFPLWLAALLSSCVFAITHFNLLGFNPIFVASDTLLAIALVILRFSTGSLWFPIGLHAMWDWTQVFLVGLGITQAPPEKSPALFQVQQNGPVLWVGQPGLPEGGLLVLLLTIGLLIGATVHLRSKQKLPRWNSRLTPSGQLRAD